MSIGVKEPPQWDLPEGWRYWEADPPQEGERIVRRTVADMESTFSTDNFMQWSLVNGASRHGGCFRYMWQTLEDYLGDPLERVSRGDSDGY